jgi:uncharacterized membrane protein YraQ (UPF0718 family)
MKTLSLAFMVAIAVVLQICVMAGDIVFVGCSVYIGMEFGWLFAILFFWLYAKSLDKVGGLFFSWKPKNIRDFFVNFVSLAKGKG